MTTELPTLVDLEQALHRLTDPELQVWIARMHRIAEHFRDTGLQRIADVFAALCVTGSEEQDRRREIADDIRRELDGDDTGCLLSEWDELPDLDDLGDAV